MGHGGHSTIPAEQVSGADCSDTSRQGHNGAAPWEVGECLWVGSGSTPNTLHCDGEGCETHFAGLQGHGEGLGRHIPPEQEAGGPG